MRKMNDVDLNRSRLRFLYERIVSQSASQMMRNLRHTAQRFWRSVRYMQTENTYISVIEDLQHISSNLDTVIADAEPQFLSVCEKLQQLFGSAQQLRQEYTRTAALMDPESEGSSFNRLESQAGESLSNFREMHGLIDSSIATMSDIKQGLENLENQSIKIKKIAHYLKIIRTNIAMESVRLSRDQEMFTSLAGEIQELSCMIDTIAGEMSNDLQEAKHRQAKAENEIKSDLAHIDEVCARAGLNVNEASTKARELVTISHEWLNRIAGHFAVVSQRVNDIVIALQSHDITRQQIEHIIEALEDLDRRQEEANGESGFENADQVGYARAMLEIQSLQLDQAMTTIRRSRESIDQAFAGIGRELEELLSDVSAEGSPVVGNDGQDNPFVYMIAELTRFTRSMDDARELDRRTGSAIEYVMTTIQSLMEFNRKIQQISADLSLKALNAIIMTEKLGPEGNALTVLGQETYTISEQSKGLIDEITMHLNELSREAEKLEHGSGDRGTEAERQALSEGINKLNDDYQCVVESAARSSVKVNSLREDIARAQKGLSFLDKIVATMSEQKARLDEYVRGLAPFAGTLSESMQAKLNKMRERYTMAEERKIHEQLTTGSHVSEDAAAVAVNNVLFSEDTDGFSAMDEDELGDNVELF